MQRKVARIKGQRMLGECQTGLYLAAGVGRLSGVACAEGGRSAARKRGSFIVHVPRLRDILLVGVLRLERMCKEAGCANLACFLPVGSRGMQDDAEPMKRSMGPMGGELGRGLMTSGLCGTGYC